MKTNIHEIYTETIKSLSSDVHGRIKYANDVIVWLNDSIGETVPS